MFLGGDKHSNPSGDEKNTWQLRQARGKSELWILRRNIVRICQLLKRLHSALHSSCGCGWYLYNTRCVWKMANLDPCSTPKLGFMLLVSIHVQFTPKINLFFRTSILSLWSNPIIMYKLYPHTVDAYIYNIYIYIKPWGKKTIDHQHQANGTVFFPK